LVFTQQHILAIEDALHAVASDELTLDTPWYETQRAEALAEEACTVATVDDYGITATLDEDCIDVRVYPSEEDCT